MKAPTLLVSSPLPPPVPTVQVGVRVTPFSVIVTNPVEKPTVSVKPVPEIEIAAPGAAPVVAVGFSLIASTVPVKVVGVGIVPVKSVPESVSAPIPANPGTWNRHVYAPAPDQGDHGAGEGVPPLHEIGGRAVPPKFITVVELGVKPLPVTEKSLAMGPAVGPAVIARAGTVLVNVGVDVRPVVMSVAVRTVPPDRHGREHGERAGERPGGAREAVCIAPYGAAPRADLHRVGGRNREARPGDGVPHPQGPLRIRKR